MLSIVNTVTIRGLETLFTEVQTTIYPGIPCFYVVGMAGKAISEATTRIRAALNSIGIDLPPRKIIINLSPTDLNKEGNYYDLPIALGILVSLGIVKNFDSDKYIVVGELALDGSIKKVNTALIAAIHATNKDMSIICPHDNGSLAMLSGNQNIVAPKNLWQLINNLNGIEELAQPKLIKLNTVHEYEYDFAHIKGQYQIKRGLELAAAGGHSIILQGPPGCGKTFGIQCLQTIMPSLTTEEIIDICLIESLRGELGDDEVTIKRPFRAPHHSASSVSIIGGGKMAEPGEVTIAHRGILFLDELAEFNPATLDALREPLESGIINISRANKHASYPANFQLVCAMNPCKCGYYGDYKKECSRAPYCVSSYQKKLSGPFLDRIDIFVNISAQRNNIADNTSDVQNEKYINSALIKKRIEYIRDIQAQRYKEQVFKLNARANFNLESLLLVEKEVIDFLKEYCEVNNLSMRSYNKIIKLSRTIADLENSVSIMKEHALEAIYFKIPTIVN